MPDPSFANPKSEFQLGEDDLQLSDYEREFASKLLRPETFLAIAEGDRLIGYLAERLAMSGLSIPISQIQGFTGFTAQSDEVITDQSTASASFVNLATTGPSVSGVAPGVYLFIWGAAAYNDSASSDAEAQICIDINGSDSTELARTEASAGERSSAVRATVKTLTATSSTITCQYRALVAGTAFFSERWLIAIKISNL